MSKTRELTVVIDPDGNECLYINGDVWDSTGETTVYATDLAAASNEEPCLFRHVAIDHVFDDWPLTLDEATRKPIGLAQVE